MSNEEARSLLEKYNKGKATKAEAALLQYWFIHEATQKEENLDEQDDQRINREIWTIIDQNTRPVKVVHLWPRIAAAVVVLMVLGTGLFYYHQRSGSGQALSYKNDLAPGSNKAILTLADGKRIILDGSAGDTLAVQAGGVRITKTAGGQLVYTVAADKNKTGSAIQYNTAETPKGGQYQVNLADGTKVWLNAASSLRYPVNFTGKERKVELSGEAYFEVAKDKLHPFKVISSGQELKVLGTHFNISAYPDEINTSTTLLEGSVQIQAASDHKTQGADTDNLVTLIPGQQSVLSKGKIQVIQTDLEQAMAWKNGMFSFKSADLKSIMRQMSRWYDVNIIYEGELPKTLYTGKIYRSVNASQVLNLLKYYQVKFRIEDKNIIVLPN